LLKKLKKYRTIILTAVIYESATSCLIKGRIQIVGVWEQNVDKNIYSQEIGSNKRV
jgi:hypothetical protein